MQKYLNLFVALSFLVMTGACMTNSLYEKKTVNTQAFEEEVSSFLITEDGKQLKVKCKQRHYIFEPNSTLKFILTWDEGNLVKATFSRFEINDQQLVSGKYQLAVEANNDLSAEAKTQLLSNGFNYNQAKTKLSYMGNLKGKYYAAGKLTIPKTFQFNQTYKITVQETKRAYSSSTAERILLTPLTITADGLLFAAGVPVLLLAIPLIAITD